jgi:hypothetical protein
MTALEHAGYRSLNDIGVAAVVIIFVDNVQNPDGLPILASLFDEV